MGGAVGPCWRVRSGTAHRGSLRAFETSPPTFPKREIVLIMADSNAPRGGVSAHFSVGEAGELVCALG